MRRSSASSGVSRWDSAGRGPRRDASPERLPWHQVHEDRRKQKRNYLTNEPAQPYREVEAVFLGKGEDE